MAPKGHRGASTNLVRTHSRSSSASRLPTNLQFTQKESPSQNQKQKKNGTGHDPHPKPVAAPFARVNSSQRVHSKDQLHNYNVKRTPPLPPQKPTGTKPKAGFTLASPGDDDDEDWVSSESGAATPDHNRGRDSDSDAEESGAITPVEEYGQHLRQHAPPQPHPHASPPESSDPHLQRVETARPSDYENAAQTANRMPTSTIASRIASLPPIQTSQAASREHHTHNQRLEPATAAPKPDQGIISPTRHHSARPTSKHISRPPSTHSITGKTHSSLHPHPLIRGQSYGQISFFPKPAPLAPLTVTSGSATAQASTSPPRSIHDEPGKSLSTSPTTTLMSPSSSPEAHSAPHRRTSISSAHSSATLPVHSAVREQLPKSLHDRNRTFSSISSSSSSAALSSLAHLPAVTRPPSPQAISFFPPVNPHANIDGIHPLLPAPYMSNHLTVLVRRTPLRESFDRVIRAKQAAR